MFHLTLGADINTAVPGVEVGPTPEPSMETVASLWHDVRQSVAVIMASVLAAQEDQSPGPEARRWLWHIGEESRRISRIFEHAVRAGSAPRRLRSLEEVTLGVVHSIRVVFSTVIDYRAMGSEINVDGVAVERALANVVANACRAAGPEGQVRIEINGEPDGSAIITVDDNGPGFGRVSAGHAGLGLEVSRRVLDPVRGSVRISEVGPLGGARVQLHLPSDSPETTPGGPA
jgi:K+-sensing histidine kinase KdpD